MQKPPEPSEWFVSHFGEHSIAVMAALVAAGAQAQERSLEAKIGSQLRTNDAYGSFWLSLREEVVAHLAFLPGLETVRPTRGRYSLPVFDHVAIFSAKCPAGTAGPDRIKLRKSRVVANIFGIEKRITAQTPLDFSSLEDDEEAEALPPVPASLGGATKLIFVAYDCTAQGGMQHIYIGEAALPEDGSVQWIYREELPLNAFSGVPAPLALVNDEPARRFDDAPLPVNVLELLTDADDAPTIATPEA